MTTAELEPFKTQIESLWNRRESLNLQSQQEREFVDGVITFLDDGSVRVAQKVDGAWVVNEWLKKAILLSFKLNSNFIIRSGQEFGFESNASYWYDKIPSKFFGWDHSDFETASIRAVPGCFVRYGSYISKSCILMPSFVNIGAYVGEGTMVDTWATIGSCAQIGANCHISGGVGIGGVLEPLQASPVIIEDNCFIGARSEIAEGVIIEQGSVIGMGVYISSSTKIFNRETGEITYGRVPAGSVVVSGSLPSTTANCGLYCAVIVKKVDSKTTSKTAINDLLRENL